jgi:hypothetical protein
MGSAVYTHTHTHTKAASLPLVSEAGSIGGVSVFFVVSNIAGVAILCNLAGSVVAFKLRKPANQRRVARCLLGFRRLAPFLSDVGARPQHELIETVMEEEHVPEIEEYRKNCKIRNVAMMIGQ